MESHFSRSFLRERYLLQPVAFQLFEAFPFGDVVDEDYSLGAFVVGSSDGSEPFLARRIPDLQFDSAIGDGDGSMMIWLST